MKTFSILFFYISALVAAAALGQQQASVCVAQEQAALLHGFHGQLISYEHQLQDIKLNLSQSNSASNENDGEPKAIISEFLSFSNNFL
jgi:hypothetical protein